MPDFAVIIEDKSSKYLFSNDNDDCENRITKEEHIGYRKKEIIFNGGKYSYYEISEANIKNITKHHRVIAYNNMLHKIEKFENDV